MYLGHIGDLGPNDNLYAKPDTIGYYMIWEMVPFMNFLKFAESCGFSAGSMKVSVLWCALCFVVAQLTSPFCSEVYMCLMQEALPPPAQADTHTQTEHK